LTRGDGRRKVLGIAIGASEAETFWIEFLRSLARRGLRGVKLVISDAHEGLKAAVAKVLHASWQRCRVHFMRNVLAHAGKQGRRVVAAFIATAFAQEDAEMARLQWRQVADQLRPKVAKLAALMDEAEADVLAFMSFPKDHRPKIHSTDEIDKPFLASSLSHVGTGSCSREGSCSPFCPSKAQPPKAVAAGSVYKAASQQRQSAVALGGLPRSKPQPLRTAHGPLETTKFGARCGIVVLHGRPRGEEQGWRMKALPRSL
jgi:hypothetical protein